MKLFAKFIAYSAVVMLLSCAKGTLTVTVDIYNGPLAKDSLSLEDIEAVKNRIVTATNLANKIADEKKATADKVLDVYTSFYKFATESSGNNFNEGDLIPLRTLQQEYTSGVDSLHDLAGKKILVARQLLPGGDITQNKSTDAATIGSSPSAKSNDRLNVDPDQFREKMAIAFTQIELAIKDLISFKSDYTRIVFNHWNDRINDLVKLAMVTDTQQKKQADFSMVQSNMKQISDLLYHQSYASKKQLSKIDQTMSSQDDKTFLHSYQAISDAFAVIPGELTPSNRLNELAELTSSKAVLFSQLDRLQDYGHSNWKVIASNLKDETMWSNKFTETNFSAQGNSSIVLVRDSPINFRPQQVNNDPSQLIQSQLTITRAIAEVGLAVTASLSGLNFDPSNSPNSISNPSSDLAAKKARLETLETMRKSAINNLINNLNSISNDIEKAGGNKDALDKAFQRLDATMAAGLLVFPKSADQTLQTNK